MPSMQSLSTPTSRAAALSVIALLAFAAAPGLQASQAKTLSSEKFTAPGTYVWEVPAGVKEMSVTALGAKGGSSCAGVLGGEGALVSGALRVSPGERLFVEVGEAGGSDCNEPAGSFAPGTIGGGGASGHSSIPFDEGVGAGGGASLVGTAASTKAPSLDAPLLVAGAGGGAGNNGKEPFLAGGGGNAGEAGNAAYEARPGGAGGQSEGGGGGGEGGASAGAKGEYLQGGAGGDALVGGGGGGGGYFGGGGGAGETAEMDGGGGGGGSDLIPEGASAELTAEPSAVMITWAPPTCTKISGYGYIAPTGKSAEHLNDSLNTSLTGTQQLTLSGPPQLLTLTDLEEAECSKEGTHAEFSGTGAAKYKGKPGYTTSFSFKQSGTRMLLTLTVKKGTEFVYSVSNAVINQGSHEKIS